RQPDEILARVVYDAAQLEPTFTTPVPPAARDLVARMIRRWPDERPGSMAEVLRDLEKLLAEEEHDDDTTVAVAPSPKPAAPPAPPPRRDRPARQAEPPPTRPVSVVPGGPAPRWPRAALLAALAVIAAAGAWLLRGGREGQQPVPVPAPRVVPQPPSTVA